MLDFTKELCPDRPLIHPTSQTKNCRFGRYVEIGDHCVLEETEVGDYTYCFGSNDIIYTALGKFNSIATGVRIKLLELVQGVDVSGISFVSAFDTLDGVELTGVWNKAASRVEF